jgi:TPR repeat protein
MSSLGREGAARPKDRLPRAPQLVMAPQLAVVPQPVAPHAEEPPSQNLSEDATSQSELGPATVPQVAHDPPIQVSGPVRASRRVLKTAVALSLAVVATGALGLVLFPNAPREAARYYSLLRPAATAPQGTSVSKREEHPSHSPSRQNAPPTPPVANAAPVVAGADAAAQPRPRDEQQPQHPQPQLQQPQSQLPQSQLPQTQQPQTQLPQTQQVTEHSLSAEEINGIINWGEKFLAQGDVATARQVLERAARTRDARVPLMLAATYDPDGLRRMGMVGVRPDLEQAKSWYTRAAELGSPEASQRLAALARLGH